jgi:hypothetical protein
VVSYSNLGCDTSHPEWRFSWFTSGSPGKFSHNILTRTQTFPSGSFPIHYSSIILTFDAMQYELLTASWNTPPPWKRAVKIRSIIPEETENCLFYPNPATRHKLIWFRTPLQAIKLRMNILQGQPLSCSVTKAIFIPQRMTLLSLSGIFTLHTKVDELFVKHKCSKCRTTFPIKITSNVNILRGHHQHLAKCHAPL